MIETMILCITAFIGTNMDDLLLDMLLFSQAETSGERNRIIIGKYLGIGALVFVSILGAFGLRALPQTYVRYLGIVPMILGIKALLDHCSEQDDEDSEEKADRKRSILINTALITIASGADNLGVYIPLFVGFRSDQLLLMVVVFAVMIRLWCLISKGLTDLPFLREILTKYRWILVPVVYIALGLYILFGK